MYRRETWAFIHKHSSQSARANSICAIVPNVSPAVHRDEGQTQTDTESQGTLCARNSAPYLCAHVNGVDWAAARHDDHRCHRRAEVAKRVSHVDERVVMNVQLEHLCRRRRERRGASAAAAAAAVAFGRSVLHNHDAVFAADTLQHGRHPGKELNICRLPFTVTLVS